jgi:large subunit ribosomal protein L24
MKKIRKGDQVVVLSGRDKGRTGSVAQVLADGKLLIEGVNVSKKHARGNPQRNQPGGIQDKAMPLHASKVAIWNSGAKKADRIGIRTLADGKRVRFLKSNNEVLDVK